MTFYIQNVETELVMDLKAPEDGDAFQLIMYDYHGGPNQLWEYKDSMIYSKENGQVLEVDMATGDISTNEPHGGINQKWHFDNDGTIRSELMRLVLDVRGGGTEPEDPVIVFFKHGGSNQVFRKVSVDN
ncbi:uncharacterized protein [Periplaneta americana]|uniref:uncharacterized protein n=1 Tax=Periplaneta americana TaxID=6978 RepID=UPI0037E993ED